MESLGQIPAINDVLKTAPAAPFRALHKFAFEEEGNRGNRKRLREFVGFKFADKSVEHIAKVTYLSRSLTREDLTAIFNLIALDYTGTKDELFDCICKGLMVLNSLQANFDKEKADDEDEGRFSK